MSEGFLLDTHIWLWHAEENRRLGKSLRRLIDGTDALWFSPVSVWEIGLLQDRGKIRLAFPVADWIDAIRAERPIEEAPFNSAVALESFRFSRDLHDPVDRFLLATAEVYDLTLITMDTQLAGAPRTRSK